MTSFNVICTGLSVAIFYMLFLLVAGKCVQGAALVSLNSTDDSQDPCLCYDDKSIMAKGRCYCLLGFIVDSDGKCVSIQCTEDASLCGQFYPNTECTSSGECECASNGHFELDSDGLNCVKRGSSHKSSSDRKESLLCQASAPQALRSGGGSYRYGQSVSQFGHRLHAYLPHMCICLALMLVIMAIIVHDRYRRQNQGAPQEEVADRKLKASPNCQSEVTFISSGQSISSTTSEIANRA